MTADPPGPPAMTPLARAVRALEDADALDMAFAAELDPWATTFRLGLMRGARAGSMDGLVTAVGQGLGGKVLALGRPLAVADYARAPGITHQFDQAVSAEGLRAVFAVPVRVEGTLHGAVYGAVRRPLEFGERFLARMVDTVRAAVRLRPAAPTDEPARDVRLTREEARDLHAVLRAARAGTTDPAARARLETLAERLHGVDTAPGVHLSARELDVLALVAVGAGNGAIAERLGLRTETVKSYLKSAMAKLGSRTRGEAVHRARAGGLLP
ncbi:LuxR C-terminal-related transcriptional regulator [Actinomycetospora rhizophila]|uniref:LuxR C-terminal-related transcriptional regulator n=1 Tax=Actinomycetospora rhizophila TaxID=1416876 RepID=A0ABV9ZE00_9PSEU